MKRILKLVLLVIVDQIIKVIIFNYFMDSRTIKFLFISFRPKINSEQMSVLNNELSLNLPNEMLIIVNVCSLVIIHLCFKWFKKKEGSFRLMGLSYNFIISGTLCSLVDLLLYNGSLDYLRIGQHIYDLKDFYLLISIILFVVLILNENVIKKLDSKSNI